MIPTFVLLAAAGGGLRLALNVAVRRKLGLSLGLPPILALAVLLLAVLPDIITPIDINLPLGLVEGLFGAKKVGVGGLHPKQKLGPRVGRVELNI